MAQAKKKAPPAKKKCAGIYYDAVRKRLEMVQEVATKTGHCVITDEQIKKALYRNTSKHLHDFVRRYGQSYDWILCGDLSGMIASRIVAAGASVRDKVS